MSLFQSRVVTPLQNILMRSAPWSSPTYPIDGAADPILAQLILSKKRLLCKSEKHRKQQHPSPPLFCLYGEDVIMMICVSEACNLQLRRRRRNGCVDVVVVVDVASLAGGGESVVSAHV